MVDPAIIERLASLKALAENSGATEGEVAAATAAITRIMFKYNLKEADIKDKVAKTKYVSHRFDILQNVKDINGRWRVHLISTLCDVNFCRAVLYGNSRFVGVTGEQFNVDVVVQMYDYLQTAIKRLTIKEWRAAHPDNYGELNNTNHEFVWKRSFRNGVVATVNRRLHEQYAASIKEADSEKANSGSALVIDKRSELDSAMSEFHPHLKENRARGSKVQDHSAYVLGRVTGNDISLNKQVSAQSTADAIK